MTDPDAISWAAATMPHYVTDANGEIWRVLDIWFALPHHLPGEWSWHQPPDLPASFRAFVADRIGLGGPRSAQSYHWRAGEDRTDISQSTLQRQLHVSEWWDRRPLAELAAGYVPRGMGEHA